ncbi:MAG: GNAT family N-acetyltransferase [Rhodospirillaceae bacterium]|nr:GNAT family N-acetyltransferase [Rhodospirillaceae bacterium]
MFELTIKTERLLLRPFKLSDAKRVQALAGLREIAVMVSSIPYPYPNGLAEAWILRHAEARARGIAYNFAITLDGELIGSIALENQGRGDFEFGYWLSKDYWGQGTMSEAAAAVLEFGFGWLAQARVIAGHYVDNPASGRILRKMGFTETHHETSFHAVRDGDVEAIRMALTKETWAEARAARA